MAAVLLKQSETDLRHQYGLVRKMENLLLFGSFRRIGYPVLYITGSYLLFYWLTDAKSFIIVKGVAFLLVTLMWVMFLGYSVWFIIKLQNRNRWFEKQIKDKLTKGNEYYMSFDDEHLNLQTLDLKLELNWSYFTFYAESPTTIFLFPKGPLHSLYSFSVSEVGETDFEVLKSTVQQKVKQAELSGAAKKKLGLI
jgi:hypothetical protein